MFNFTTPTPIYDIFTTWVKNRRFLIAVSWKIFQLEIFFLCLFFHLRREKKNRKQEEKKNKKEIQEKKEKFAEDVVGCVGVVYI